MKDRSKWLTLEQLVEGETPVTIINERVEAKPVRESATARAMRLWFKQKLERSDEA